jgi:hypothetical protein
MTVATMLNKTIWCLCSLVLALVLCGAAPGETVLFQSRQVTRAGEYTFRNRGARRRLRGKPLRRQFSEGWDHRETEAAHGSL